MKKNTIIILAVFIVFLGLLFVVRLISPEDTWICVDNNWVKHGNPSSPKPANGCGDSVAVIAIDFDETGHFVKDNPGLKPGVWYLVYEKPGSPALYKELVFDNQSVCMLNGKQGTCPDVFFPSSALTQVRGMISGEVVRVVEATSGGTTPIVTTQNSGISGTVLLGPTCPVMRNPPDPQCADRPFSTKLVLKTSDGSSVVKEFSSDSYGNFSVQISPGEYQISGAPSTNILPRCSSNGTIRVLLNTYTETTIYCDTGIR